MTINYPEFVSLWGAIHLAGELVAYFLLAILVLFITAYLYDVFFNR